MDDLTRLLLRLERAQQGRARCEAEVTIAAPIYGEPEATSQRLLHRQDRYHALVHGLSRALIVAQHRH